jgi:hypothetical protein
MMIVTALAVFTIYWFITPRMLRWLGWQVKQCLLSTAVLVHVAVSAQQRKR